MTDTADLERRLREGTRTGERRNELLLEAGRALEAGLPKVFVDGLIAYNDICEEAADALAAQRERIKALEDVLGAIGWHELTWKEARDRARAALGARK